MIDLLQCGSEVRSTGNEIGGEEGRGKGLYLELLIAIDFGKVTGTHKVKTLVSNGLRLQ